MRYFVPVMLVLGFLLILIGQFGPLEVRLTKADRALADIPDAADLIVARTKGSDCARLRAKQFTLAKLTCSLWPMAEDCSDWPKTYDSSVLQSVYCRAAVEEWRTARQTACDLHAETPPEGADK